MEKLILDNLVDEEDVYRLELPDGSVIEFDLLDINLAENIMNAEDELRRMGENEQEELRKIFEEKDEVVLGRKLIQYKVNKDKKRRELFDSFLGKGTCDKLFGNKKKDSQYFILLDALTPHFKKMNELINDEERFQRTKQKLANKYMPKDEDVM